MAQLLKAGQRLAGYEIVELVGRGGMGEVYRARQLSMDREVALKVLSPRLARQDPSFARRFVDEARAAGRLNHANIIGVHDVGEAPAPAGLEAEGGGGTVHYFSMEFIEGESVKGLIERHGPLDEETLALVMVGMAEAMVYAETQGIVHRDIKPDNIMLTTTRMVKLADLGLALQLGAEEGLAEKGETRQVMGTPLYMSPEQARALPVDHRSDQYSLGATLYHMLTGRPPYTGENAKTIMKAHVYAPIPDPQAVSATAPEAWRQLCLRLLAKKPDERFATNAELRSAVIKAALGGKGAASVRRMQAGRGGGKQAMPAWAGWLAAGLVVALGALIAIPLLGRGGGAAPPPAEPAPANPVRPVAPPVDPLAERVSRALAGLPADRTQAMAALRALLAQADLRGKPQSAPAEQRLRELEADAARASREAVERDTLARIREIEEAIAAGRLRQSGEALARLQGPEVPLRDKVRALASRQVDAVLAAVSALREQADKAASADAVRALLGKADSLPEEQAKGLRGHLAVRLRSFEELASAARTDEDRKQWLALMEELEPLRGDARRYQALQLAAEAAAPRFATDEARAAVRQIAEGAKLASRLEGALQALVAETRPKVEGTVNGRTGVFVLCRLDGTTIATQPSSGTGAESKTSREKALLPWAKLAADALARLPADLAPLAKRAQLAFLWFWRLPEHRALLAQLNDDPFAGALREMIARTRLIEVPGLATRVDGLLQVSYPFAGKEPELLLAWQGEGLAYGDRGARWSSDRAVANNTYREADMPTVQWKLGLIAPASLEAEMAVARDGTAGLIGLAAGARRLRIGLSGDGKAFALVTRDDDETYEAVLRKPVPSVAPGQPARLAITVAADGSVLLTCNGQPVCDRELKLPTDKPLVPIWQIRQVKGQTAIEVLSLTFRGKQP